MMRSVMMMSIGGKQMISLFGKKYSRNHPGTRFSNWLQVPADWQFPSSGAAQTIPVSKYLLNLYPMQIKNFGWKAEPEKLFSEIFDPLTDGKNSI